MKTDTSPCQIGRQNTVKNSEIKNNEMNFNSKSHMTNNKD